MEQVHWPTWLDAHCLHGNPELKAGRQRHDHHEINYVIRGKYRLKMGRHEFRAAPGDAFYVPVNTWHESDYPKLPETQLFTFQWSSAWKKPMPEFAAKVQDASMRLLMALRWLSELWPHEEAGDRRCSMGLWLAVMEEYRRLSTVDVRKRSPITRAKDVLESHYHRQLQVSEISEMVGMSKGHFIRSFKAELGVTPNQYRLKMKVAAAMRLIQASNLTLEQIAARVGVTDAAYLCRLIKKEHGRHPSSFRSSR